MSLLSQRIAGQEEEEEDLEDGIMTGTIEGGTTVIEGEVAIGTIEEETFTAQSLTNEQLLLLYYQCLKMLVFRIRSNLVLTTSTTLD